MKAKVHGGWGAIEHDGTEYDVQDGTLDADAAVIEALHERYGEKVKPVDEAAKDVESVEATASSESTPDYAAMSYDELRSLAADEDTDEINGRSSKDDIIAYFTDE